VNCADPAYNIGKGASYLQDQINQQGGNFLLVSTTLSLFTVSRYRSRGKAGCGLVADVSFSTTLSPFFPSLKAMGGYNGWYQGMQGSGACGPDGQNLNYLNGLLNGFAQGKDGNDISQAC